MKQVYEFRDGGKEMTALLGGKGANLAEMAKIDLTSREWCELVFEGKNKAYGAYT